MHAFLEVPGLWISPDYATGLLLSYSGKDPVVGMSDTHHSTTASGRHLMYNVVIPFDQAASRLVLEISQRIDAMLSRT
jgi:hypothetical protein